MKTNTANTLVVLVTLVIIFSALEITYRILDPFPYIDCSEINASQYGNLLQYDLLLGWKGITNAKDQFITHNTKTLIQHNDLGFRDIHHNTQRDGDKPKIVFIGDSFTWGYEVTAEEMFVNRIRARLPNYSVYNLAHRGYGTDQALLTLKNWPLLASSKLVVLMFYENDVSDNNSSIRYSKNKPQFLIEADRLVLSNVPVPRQKEWDSASNKPTCSSRILDRLEKYLAKSHFLHEVYYKLRNIKQKFSTPNLQAKSEAGNELGVTSRLLQELQKEVTRQGATLLIVAIPSVNQLAGIPGHPPYSETLGKICQQLGIDYLDLSPIIQDAVKRTYFRIGIHWNAYGNHIAAEAIYDFLLHNKLVETP